ncbi:MAG: helix-turn-helix transcriptional regulator [Clostridia bacterium]|nr:helix-turn-helix transcriptional regulator [Clostridia bacterium]
MTLGEKIKELRKNRHITQSELCGDKITRNMLSAIECDKASPSISTLEHIASRLGVPPSYLLSNDENLFFYEKQASIAHIKDAFMEKKYQSCINAIGKLSDTDDELRYILAHSHFELGRKFVLRGSLVSGLNHLKLAKGYSQSTIYDTEQIDRFLLLFSALATNIQAPLLEFEPQHFEDTLDTRHDYELYRYVLGDTDYKYKNPIFAKHLEAKRLMKDTNYRAALALLEEIAEEKKADKYNCYVMFKVYTDMEQCSKQLMNFENAYKYSSKRMSMLEGFKS